MALTENPKLAMIPSGYGDYKVYSVLPSDGTGDFDFVRSSAATRVNKSGLIETVGFDVPRLNYPLIDGVVSGCPSLLLEPSRTNLITYSEDFSNVAWSKTNVTLVSDNGVSPDGTNNAYLMYPTATDANFTYTYHQVNNVTVSQYTISAFVKSSGVNVAWLYIQSVNSVGLVYFDLSDKSIQVDNGSSNTLTAEMTAVGNGWYKISCTNVTPIAITSGHGIGISDAKGSRSITKNGTNGVYIYGFQLEQGSYPTSYIPTNGGTVTRSAETCNGAGDADTFNDSEGVLMMEASVLDISTTNSWVSISQNSNYNSNQFNLRFVASSNLIQAVSRAGGLGQDVVLQYTLTDKTLTNKISIKYKLNDWALWVNGFEVDTETSSNAFTPNSLDVLDFDRGNNSNNFYGNTKQIQYFDTALTDTDLEELTSWTSFNEMAQSQLYKTY